MARLTFPDDRGVEALSPARFKIAPAAGTAVPVFTSSSGVTPASLAAHADYPDAVSGTSVLLDAYGQFPLFLGPADGTDTLWVSVNGGPMRPLYARVDDRLDDVTGRVVTLEGSSAVDAAVLHKSGTETVTGAKDFTGALTKSGTPVVVTSDSRLSDQRVPTDGSVTLAKLAFDVATQAELDAQITALPGTFAPLTIINEGVYSALHGPQAVDRTGGTDTSTALQAALNAAAAVVETHQLSAYADGTSLPVAQEFYIPPGEYKLNTALTWPQGLSIRLAKGARLKAGAAMTALIDTSATVLHQGESIEGGILDCNALAASALYLRYCVDCRVAVDEVFDPTQHGIIIGDTGSTNVSYGADVRVRKFWRPRGTTPPAGYAALYMQSVTDSVAEVGQVRGFDIGTKNDGGNNEFRTIHPWNPTGATGPTTCHDESAAASGTRLMGYVFDTPGTYGLRVRGNGPITLIAPQFYLNAGAVDNTAIAIKMDATPSLSFIGGAIYAASVSHRWAKDLEGTTTRVRWQPAYVDSATVVTRNFGDRHSSAGHFYQPVFTGITPMQISTGGSTSVDAMQLFNGATKIASIRGDGGFQPGSPAGAGVAIYSVAGAPALSANLGDMCIRKDGGAGTWLYRCTTASSATTGAWTAVA